MQVLLKVRTLLNRQYQCEYITGYSLDETGACDGLSYGPIEQAKTFEYNSALIKAIGNHIAEYRLTNLIHADEHVAVGFEISPCRPIKTRTEIHHVRSNRDHEFKGRWGMFPDQI